VNNEGLSNSVIRNILDLSSRRVRLANSVEIKPLNYYLKQLGFLRKKAREKLLYEWLMKIAPYESGRDKRYFTWTGNIDLMYSKYLFHFDNDYALAYGKRKFIDVTKHERIGIHSGDVFFDSVKIKYKRMTENLDAGIEIDEEEYETIKDQYEFNNERKEMLRDFIQKLQGDKSSFLTILDFSQLQMSLTNKFHTFVVVIISDEEIEVPADLEEMIIKPEKPYTMTDIVGIDSKIKRSRGKNKEKNEDMIPDSFNAYIQKEKKIRFLSKTDIHIERYSPHHLHFHFAMKQTLETPGQIAPFVFHALDTLFSSGSYNVINLSCEC
jgi:hypothetical protein